MKYLAVDVETTGLDPKTHQILEIAAIADDLEDPRPLEELPSFHCLVRHETLLFERPALVMNLDLVRQVYEGPDDIRVPSLLPGVAARSFVEFCSENFSVPADPPAKQIILAGKNVQKFDKPFLEQFLTYKPDSLFHHRAIDPANFYLAPGDQVMPGLKLCLERAGKPEVELKHRAFGDTVHVIHLIRTAFGLPGV